MADAVRDVLRDLRLARFALLEPLFVVAPLHVIILFLELELLSPEYLTFLDGVPQQPLLLVLPLLPRRVGLALGLFDLGRGRRERRLGRLATGRRGGCVTYY